jgi:hypothetical protein
VNKLGFILVAESRLRLGPTLRTNKDHRSGFGWASHQAAGDHDLARELIDALAASAQSLTAVQLCT